MADLVSLPGLAIAAAFPCVCRWILPWLMDVLRSLIRARTALRLEQERRTSLLAILTNLRPGIWAMEQTGSGYLRCFGYQTAEAGSRWNWTPVVRRGE